ENLTKNTTVFCEHFNFHGTIEELKEHLEDIGELENFPKVTVKLSHLEPFMTVDDEWLIDLIQREVEMQGCDNERSSEHGDEMDKVSEAILEHITIDYKAIMEKMPRLYYGERKEIQINLKDF